MNATKTKTVTRKPSAQAVQAAKAKARTPKDEYTESELEADVPEARETITKNVQVKSQARNMSGTKRIFTDLFKLKVATVIKYEGWEDEGVEYPNTHPNKFTSWEHTHPFRNYDRKGSKVTYSTPIGGHFHVIEWEEVEGGTPIIKSVSGPMVMGKQKVKGKGIVSMPVPANDFDDHTHEIEYIRSAEVVVSSTNMEASAVVSADANKYAPVNGVRS